MKMAIKLYGFLDRKYQYYWNFQIGFMEKASLAAYLLPIENSINDEVLLCLEITYRACNLSMNSN